MCRNTSDIINLIDNITNQGYYKNMKEQYPKRYKAKFIEPGVISYDDLDMGNVLVSKEALDKMSETFVGRPVINVEHEDLTPEQAFKLSDKDTESLADGVVYNTYWKDGWYWVEFLAWDLDTQENLDKNDFSVSCAYLPTEVKEGSSYNGIDYDEEVLNGKYTHLAIVDSPRYIQSKVYLNSKGAKDMKKFKLFSKNVKKNAVEEEKPEEEENINMDESYIESEGEKIPLSAMIEAYKTTKTNKSVISMEDTVEVDGEQVPVKALYDAYKSGCEKPNAEPPMNEDMEESVDEEAQKTNKIEKPNKSFKSLKNKIEDGDTKVKMVINTKSERLNRGKNRYSKTVENGGKS